MVSKKVSLNDPIHSRINLTEVEYSVISHPIFQRLRRVKALGFLDRVFTSARHSRFEHSIGACHITGKMMDNLIKNHDSISDLRKWRQASELKPWTNLKNFLTDDRIQQVRLAALLHDIGHGPFSHASERIMPTKDSLLKNTTLPDFITSLLNSSDQADHEDFSIILAWEILHDVKCKHGQINDDYIQDVLAFKFSKIPPTNVINKDAFSLFSSFVSGDFDSDRMDYLIRDSYFCGVPYGKFDLERLLEGIFILQDSNNNSLTLALKKSSLTAFEDFLFARFQMHIQVYSHRVDAAFNIALEKIVVSQKKILPWSIKEYASIDDESFLSKMELTKNVDLTSLLFNREKWELLYETNDSSDSKFDSLETAVGSTIPEDKFGIYKTDKPLNKSTTILKLPVIITQNEKDYHTNLLEKETVVLSINNMKYFAKRIFIHPSHIAEAKAIFLKVEQELVKDDKLAQGYSEKAALEKSINSEEDQLKEKKIP